MDTSPRPLPEGPPFQPDAIIALCMTRLRRFASRMLSRYTKSRRKEDTDDLLQNAALRLHRALGDVHVESTEHALALAITQIKRELLDMIRRLKRRPDGVPITPDIEPIAQAERLERWEEFHRQVQQLPEHQRQAVHFLWYLGLDQERAAAALGISSRTLRRDWRMARDALRRELGELDFLD